MISTLFTIGYEGATLQAFINTLKKMGVKCLYDIRELPLSRKPGFSKRSLQEALEAEGIQYIHERRLGAPKEARAVVKSGGEWVDYFKIFDRYLQSQQAVIEEIANSRGKIVLMCMERDVDNCHRKSVAREISKIAGIKPTHIGVPLG